MNTADLAIRRLTDAGISVNEIIGHLNEVTGRGTQTIYKPGRTIDVPKSVLDSSLAQRTFDWTLKTPLKQGLTENWHWLKDLA